MAKTYYAAIMAGGGGTRLWPLSRRKRPKQVLELFNGKSLFQLAVNRLTPLFSPDQIVVLCPPGLREMLNEQAPQLPRSSFFLEPEPRGNAAAIGLAALRLRQIDPECVMACLTADHIIQDQDRFHALLDSAKEAALEGKLVTLGIEPVLADPGFGYLERGDLAGEYGGLNAFHVAAFKEKPKPDLAARYLKSGKYAWNSGMFVWQVASVLAEMERQMPELYAGLMKIDKALGTMSEDDVIADVWSGLEPTSIDYGIMEGAQHSVMFAAQNLGWEDVGDWSRLQRLSDPDEQGNVIQAGKTSISESKRVFVFQGSSDADDRLIVLHGVDDLILVETGDVLLVCRRDRAGEVKDLVENLKRSGLDRYL